MKLEVGMYVRFKDKKCIEYCSCCKFCPYYQEKYMKGEENDKCINN